MKVEMAVNLACVLEATAGKPGNVNRSSDFHDTSLVDFLASAAAITPVFSRTKELSTADLVLHSVRATRKVTSVNTNLGIVLLLAPLAKSFLPIEVESGNPGSGFQSRLEEWQKETERLVGGLGAEQADLLCHAITMAAPGGLGNKKEGDVRSGAAGRTVFQMMELAQSDDLIARQYTTGFQVVFQDVAPNLRSFLKQGCMLQVAVIGTFLCTLAKYPDSLIARKNGLDFSQSISARAAKLGGQWRELGCPGYDSADQESQDFWKEMSDFDFFLRSDQNRRNPGTTADLIAAGLFVLLCTDQIPFPLQW